MKMPYGTSLNGGTNDEKDFLSDVVRSLWDLILDPLHG